MFELNGARQRSKVACQAPYNDDTNGRINKAVGVQDYASVLGLQRGPKIHFVLAKQLQYSKTARGDSRLIKPSSLVVDRSNQPPGC
jgi:hypothetical protein